MLIVCPRCATSYMIDPSSVAPAGRTVRCARCKSTWFAGAPERDVKTAPAVSAFVDGVIAEAEAQSGGAPGRALTAAPLPVDRASGDIFATTGDDFGGETAAQAGASDVADIPVADAPPLVPPIEHEPQADAGPDGLDPEDIESFAARRERLRSKRDTKRRSSRWTALILLLLAFNVALIGARNDVVRFLPQTASLFSAIGLPVNLRHLRFDDVRISRDRAGGANLLIVEGTIVNTAGSATEVPRLRFAARNAGGQEIYTWTMLPTRSILEAGDKLKFRSELAAPPAEAADVLVRFFGRQDTIPGGK
jgi:predicted Zn finger-like uncharacterized protein